MTRRLARRPVTASAALIAAFALGACGGGPDAAEVLSETADRMGEVRSGDLDMRLLAAPADRPQRGIGFELTGPFSLAKRDPLPATRMRYTRLLGARRVSAVLTSTGREAYVTADGKTTQLDAAVTRRLAARRQSDKPRTLASLGLDIDAWFEDPRVEDGPKLDGEATDRVTGRLKTGRATRDVLRALRRGGAGVPEAGETLVKRIDALTEQATAEVVSGRKDHLLRRLTIKVKLRPTRELDAAIPGAGAVLLTAGLELRRPNRPVKIDRPR